MTNSPTTATTAQLLEVLDDLVGLMAGMQLDDRAITPCADLNYSELLQHIVGWLTAFTDGLTFPAGRCSDPDDVVVMGDGAYQVQRCAQRLADALADVAADRPLWIGETQLPTGTALQLILLEYQLHGWDLARTAGQSWAPGQEGVAASLAFAPGILTPDSQGEGRMYGPRVQVAPDAEPFDRLLGLCGRDPAWGTVPDTPAGLDTTAGLETPAEQAAAAVPQEPVRTPAAPPAPGAGPRRACATFTVTEFTPQPFTPAVDTALDTGYTLMRKQFSGAIEGWAQTQFMSAFDMELDRGSYLALESFTGTVDGRRGTFNLAHSATAYGGTERVHEFVLIVPFSGTGELTGITGTGTILIDADGTHHLHLYYRL